MSRSADERLAQWERTVRLFVHKCSFYRGEERLGSAWLLGEIVSNTRVFLAGDHVIVTVMNGGGERQPVHAVSGKGVHVRGSYLAYHTEGWRTRKDKNGKVVKRFRSIGTSGRFSVVDCDMTRPFNHDHGPLRFVEHPGELTDLPPAHPDVRRFVEARVRAVPIAG